MSEGCQRRAGDASGGTTSPKHRGYRGATNASEGREGAAGNASSVVLNYKHTHLSVSVRCAFESYIPDSLLSAQSQRKAVAAPEPLNE